jgi:fumarate reductase subunit C
MIKFIKYLILSLVAIVVGFFTISLVFGFIFFRNSPDCSGDSPAAEYVRSLSESRLERLYKDMEYFYHKDGDPYKEYLVHEKADIPEEFSDLKVVRVSPKNASIMVVGCFDNYMYLRFRGIEEPAEKEIVLQYGEHNITLEKIWPKL